MSDPTDFAVENHGSVFLLRPFTEEAGEWVAEHIPEDAQIIGSAIAVEPRYIEQIVTGILNDGLTVG